MIKFRTAHVHASLILHGNKHQDPTRTTGTVVFFVHSVGGFPCTAV